MNLYERFYTTIKTDPERVRIIDGDRRIPGEALLKFIDGVYARFDNRRPRRVGIVMEHGVEMIASIFAVLKSGAAYVPAEPSFPIERIKYMMREAGVDFVIVSDMKARAMLKEFKPLVIDPGMPPYEAKPLPAVDVPDNAEAYILYTSGTTGKPKGVVVEQRNVLNYVKAFEHEFHIGPNDVMLQYSVCTFDIFVEEVFASLLNGASLAIPTAEVRNNLRTLLRYAGDKGVTIISGFPYLLLEFNKMPEALPSSIRLLISGGDVLRKSYIDNLLSLTEIYNTYGPSETTVCSNYFRCTADNALPDGTFPVGHDVSGVNVTVVDDNLREVPLGTTGQFLITGAGVSRGYVKHVPESANFITLGDGSRGYLSGDLGYKLPSGDLAFICRNDSQVMIGGKRVECGEVENVLNELEGVESAVVCPVTDRSGLSHLVAYIVPDPVKYSLRKIKGLMKRYLAAFMIPETFVTLKQMPLTRNGKVDRAALVATVNNKIPFHKKY